MRKRRHENELSIADFGRMVRALRLLREIEAFGVRLTHERTERKPLTPKLRQKHQGAGRETRRRDSVRASAHPQLS